MAERSKREQDSRAAMLFCQEIQYFLYLFEYRPLNSK